MLNMSSIQSSTVRSRYLATRGIREMQPFDAIGQLLNAVKFKFNTFEEVIDYCHASELFDNVCSKLPREANEGSRKAYHRRHQRHMPQAAK